MIMVHYKRKCFAAKGPFCMGSNRDMNNGLLCNEIRYCRTGNFSDVKPLANLAIDSFSLKFQVANALRH